MEGSFGFRSAATPRTDARAARVRREAGESVAEAQREQFATLTLNTAVALTAAISRR